MYTLTITCPDFESLSLTIARLGNQIPLPEESSSPKKTLKSLAIKDGTAGAITKVITEVEEKNAEVTYDDMKDLILDVVKKKGRNASLDLLAEFDVVSGEGKDRTGDISKLTKDKYVAVAESAKKILEA